jgi:peptidylprolyl isomerase
MKIVLSFVAIVAILGAGFWFVFMRGQAPSPPGALGINLSYDQYDQGGAQQQVPGAQTQSSDTAVTTNQNIMQATLHTTKGDIVIEFMGTDAPKTVENFTKLASGGFYNGTKFHRVINGFMIQGGDPLSKDDAQSARWGTGGPGYQFADEIHANNRNVVGTISMANAGPNTNGSQFFINTADNNFLDSKHTVFGKVVAGLEVVKAIEATPTGAGDRPLQAMVITSVTLK